MIQEGYLCFITIYIWYLVHSCSCMEDELLKKMGHFQNKSIIDIQNHQRCYVKLPSNCRDLIDSSYFYGLFTSEEAFYNDEYGATEYRMAAKTGTLLCFCQMIDTILYNLTNVTCKAICNFHFPHNNRRLHM